MSDATVERSSAARSVPKEKVRQKPDLQVVQKPPADDYPDKTAPLGSARNPIPPQPLPEYDFAVKLFRLSGIRPPTDCADIYKK
jgi:hypothetical protein